MARPAILLLGVLLLAGCGGDDDGGYDAEFQDDFTSACVDAVGGEMAAPICDCWYEAVSGSIDFEDLPPVEDLVSGDLDEGADRVEGGDADRPLVELAGCVRGLNAEPTLPATTAPVPTVPAPRPPPTTTTTTTPS
jgi:hypothetical protein